MGSGSHICGEENPCYSPAVLAVLAVLQKALGEKAAFIALPIASSFPLARSSPLALQRHHPTTRRCRAHNKLSQRERPHRLFCCFVPGIVINNFFPYGVQKLGLARGVPYFTRLLTALFIFPNLT